MKFKKLQVYKVVIYMFLFLWILCIIGIIPYLEIYSLLLVGILLIFINFLLSDLSKGEIVDLNITDFSKVKWEYIMKKIIFSLFISSFIILFINLAIVMKKSINSYPTELGIQLLGGFIPGMIGFLSALFMYKYQQVMRSKKKRRDYLNELWFEIVHNKFSVKLDSKHNMPFWRKLENRCWNSVISSKTTIDGKVKGGLSLLYNDIDFYNYLYQLQRIFITQDDSNNSKVVKVMNDMRYKVKFHDLVLKELEEYSAIVFGEMVRLGYKKKTDWNDKSLNWKKIYGEYIEKNSKKTKEKQ